MEKQHTGLHLLHCTTPQMSIVSHIPSTRTALVNRECYVLSSCLSCRYFLNSDSSLFSFPAFSS